MKKMPPEEIINQKKQRLTMNTPTCLQLKCYGKHKNKILRRKKKDIISSFLFCRKLFPYKMKLLIFGERHNKTASQTS